MFVPEDDPLIQKDIIEIIEKLDLPEIRDNQVKGTKSILRDYMDVFATGETKLSSIPGILHKMELTDETPIRQRLYNADVRSQEIIDDTVNTLLEQGIIEVSESEWSSPVVLVKKPDESYRMCVDYRKINRVLRKEEWPIPKIADILDNFHNAKYFSTLDLKSGFFQIKMEEKSKKYTAFITKKGLYQYKYMPFGLKSNPGFNFTSKVLNKIQL